MILTTYLRIPVIPASGFGVFHERRSPNNSPTSFTVIRMKYWLPDAGLQTDLTALLNVYLRSRLDVRLQKYVDSSLGRYERVQENIRRRETDEDGDYRW